MMGTNYLEDGMSERSRRLEEVHFSISEIVENAGRKIGFFVVTVLEKSKKAYHSSVSCTKNVYMNVRATITGTAQRAKRFFIDNTIICYVCGGGILVAGTYLFGILSLATSQIFLPWWIIFVVGFLIWVPICYGMRSFRYRNVMEQRNAQLQVVDKPPSYDSLPNTHYPISLAEDETPPTYEEVFAASQASECHSFGVPLSAVHQSTRCGAQTHLIPSMCPDTLTPST